MEPIRKLPIGVQSFEKLIGDGYLYVDKTAYIYDIVRGGTQYFLSRPRRFGKSLLLSTLRAYWEGRRKLFQGLAIEKLETEQTAVPGAKESWQSYPVFYFDFNRADFTRTGGLEDVIDAHLAVWEKCYGVMPQKEPLEVRFQNLLATAHQQTGKRCVVLVDEYDKPLLEVLHKPALEEHNKAVFKGFFSTLKSYDEHLQFAFLTGVTKFSKESIFSDLNQLNDISMDKPWAGICGITEAEMLRDLGPEIERMAENCEVDPETCVDRLKRKYDGYHFAAGSTGVYNPFSLLNALAKRECGNYWFSTGTPTFLVRKVREAEVELTDLTEGEIYATQSILTDYRADNPDPVPLMYQTGYLTLTDYDREADYYTLGFPNEEVRTGFLESLLAEYAPNAGAASGKSILAIRRHLFKGDPDRVMKALEALFASLPYSTSGEPDEHLFECVTLLVFELLGVYAKSEVHVATGRADCIVETPEYVYLFEFKRDSSAEEALAQIEEKGYAAPYAADSRTLYRIGASFDSEKRVLAEWKIE